MRRGGAALACALAVVGVAGCGDGSAERIRLGTPGAEVVSPTAVPAQINWLASTEEDVSKALEAAGPEAYITSARLWSLREGSRLRATVQVARFAPDAPTGDAAFRALVVGQLGGSSPRRRRIGGDEVFVAGGNRQIYYSWFRGIHFVVMSVPGDTPGGRALVRAALSEVRP